MKLLTRRLNCSPAMDPEAAFLPQSTNESTSVDMSTTWPGQQTARRTFAKQPERLTLTLTMLHAPQITSPWCSMHSPESFPFSRHMRRDVQEWTRMAAVPNAPTPFVRIGLISTQPSWRTAAPRSHRAIRADSILSWAAINPRQSLPAIANPHGHPKSLTFINHSQTVSNQSGAHETATTADDWRLGGFTAANRNLQRPLMKTARHSRPYCGNARLGLTIVPRVKDRHPANHSSLRGPS